MTGGGAVPERVAVPDGVVFREVSGEAVILDLASQRYFSLDRVGTRMWGLLAAGDSLERVRERLQEEYEVDAGVLRQDLEGLVRELLDEGLLRPA